MKLGIKIDLVASRMQLDMEFVHEAERLGYDSVWCGESYSSDSVSPVAWMLANTKRIKAGTGIMQIPGRTPACAAMTVMTLQALSGGRMLCGLGASGPQVVEGWHGVPFGSPLQRTREYLSIIQKIIAREAPLTHEGVHYQIPYTGEGATGLGKPLRSIVTSAHKGTFYTASITPAALRMAGETADGTLPIFMSPEAASAISEPLSEGLAKRASPLGLKDFDIAPYTRIRMGDDLQACRDALRPELALYIGGMGARGKNFYNDYVKRLGFEDAARTIQDLYLDGKKDEAAAAVPDRLIDETALVGPPDRIRARLKDWQAVAKEGHVGTLVLVGADIPTLRVVAETVL